MSYKTHAFVTKSNAVLTSSRGICYNYSVFFGILLTTQGKGTVKMEILGYILWTLLGIIGALLSLVIVFIIVLIISAAVVDRTREYDKNSRYYRIILGLATAAAFAAGLVRIHKSGLEKLPDGQRFLLVCNHRSKFDPLVTWHVMYKYDIAFISKKENFDVVVFGRLIRKCCFMAINRENTRAALETVNKAAGLLKKDEVSVGIYPEGTRNYDDGLLPFHNGSFKIAQIAEVPIVVVCLQGTEVIRHKIMRRPSHVYFDVVDVLPADYVTSHRTAEISERVRAAMENKLAEGDPNAGVKAKIAEKESKKQGKDRKNENKTES